MAISPSGTVSKHALTFHANRKTFTVQGRKIFYPRSRHAALLRFVRFGIVGAGGFLWDWGSVTALRPLIGLTAATLIAYFIAATANWLTNRAWTFRGVVHRDHPVLQWLRFLLANSLGFFLNRSAVYLLYAFSPLCRAHPGLALAAGAAAGMMANFNLSQRLVFREKAPESAADLAHLAVDLPKIGTPPTPEP